MKGNKNNISLKIVECPLYFWYDKKKGGDFMIKIKFLDGDSEQKKQSLDCEHYVSRDVISKYDFENGTLKSTLVV